MFWARSRVSLAWDNNWQINQMFLQQFQGSQQRNIKYPHYWPFVWRTMSDQLIPLTKGHQCRNCFNVMRSSWPIFCLSWCGADFLDIVFVELYHLATKSLFHIWIFQYFFQHTSALIRWHTLSSLLQITFISVCHAVSWYYFYEISMDAI